MSEKKSKKTEFSLTIENLKDEIRKLLRERKIIVKDYWGDSYEENEFYYQDIKDDVVITVSNDWTQLYGIPFTVSGDKVTLDFDNKVPYVNDYRPKEDGEEVIGINFANVLNDKIKYSIEKAESLAKESVDVKETAEYKALSAEFSKVKEQLEQFSNKTNEDNVRGKDNEQFEVLQQNYNNLKDKLDNVTKEFESLKQTNSELEKVKNEFEKEKLTTQVDSTLKEFSFTEDEVKDMREQAINKEITLDTLKDKCYVLVGKKALQNKQEFSVNKDEKASVHIPNKKESENIYGELTEYFANLNKNK